MGDIRSAREIALEKIEKLGEATEEERLKWKYVPEGEKLCADYLKRARNLAIEIEKYEEGAKRYVIEGAAGILIRNINLPRNDTAKRNNKQAMDGIKVLKTDKVGVENVYSKIRRIFTHYAEDGEQQRKQAYESLKVDFEAKVQQAMQQQLGTMARMNIDVEKQPQFHEEWRNLLIQLDSQYLTLLDEYKQELANIN